MGREVTASVSINGKKEKRKVLLESNELILRGEGGMRIPFASITALSSKNEDLTFRFEGKSFGVQLGEESELWMKKIKNPKTLMEKLGVQPDSVVSVINIQDKQFLDDLKKKTPHVSIGKVIIKSDLIFYEANSAAEMKKLSTLKKHLVSNGGIWVVSRKGKAATIKDTEVMRIGKECGLVDIKVVGFSLTHTALKFVIPLSMRS